MLKFIQNHPKWFLAIQVIPFVVAVIAIKLLFNFLGWEVLTISPLLTSLIAANVFLLGFLISGILSDYKESEKLPGEMAASLETIADECEILYNAKKAKPAKDCLRHIYQLNISLLNWFVKEERSKNLMKDISYLNHYFLAFEPLTQANFISRLKQEQNILRKQIIRTHTIRETSFVKAGYTIAEITTGLLLIGLCLTEILPFYESLFLLGTVSFLLIYMQLLIKDLDNPFDHYESKHGSRVSLMPLEETKKRLEAKLNAI
jgi:hypothetical protein